MAACSTEIDHIIRLFDLNSGEIVRTFEQLDGDCLALEFANNLYLVAISEIGTIYLMEIASAKTIFKENLNIKPKRYRKLLEKISEKLFLIILINKFLYLDISPTPSIRPTELSLNWLENAEIRDVEWNKENKIFNIVYKFL